MSDEDEDGGWMTHRDDSSDLWEKADDANDVDLPEDEAPLGDGPKKPTRRVVVAYHESLPRFQSPNSQIITALCDDGTVWEREHRKTAGGGGSVEWRKLDEIPTE